MEKKRLLIRESKEGLLVKDILVASEPSRLKPLLNPVSWKIATLLAERPMYPAQVARELRIHEQTVYSYIRRLVKAGLLKVEREEMVKGAVARYYTIPFGAVAAELPKGERKFTVAGAHLTYNARSFLEPFLQDGAFNGRIVVGSPDPHGPEKTMARDGHYAVHLAFFLGQLCKIPSDFVVKLDVDVKTEKEVRQNLILIGGPGTNLLSLDVNKYLPIRFNEKNIWAGLKDNLGRTFNIDRDAVIARIKNPFDPSRVVIVLAGVRAVGTKSAIIGLANFADKVLEGYKGEDNWAVAIRGYDLDGDGKVDSVEVVS
ncbi:MAG: helix-turn-helix domain-containing protein [Thaumarchaeota archaeon]|nr:helix-turn-helix domain-containing protein [Nitrososphaerota archaeon]